MAYNWCWWLRNFFDVTVLYCTGDEERLRKMSRIVKMERYQEGKTYECDIFIRNSVWGTIPKGIKAKRMIEMRHANYKYLIEQKRLYNEYQPMGIKEIVGCGEFVSKMSDEVLHDHPTTIKNILLPKRETKKILKLISCTRLDPAKGWDRMMRLMDMMKNAGIKFEWNIFTNSRLYKCDYEEVHFWKQRYDIWDYLADADYTVLLSDSEGLPYTIQESLQYKVPCIVTDVGGCTELIKDGVNGYVVPLDMNFDINKIRNIPKCPEYDNGALEAWLKYLEYDGKKVDKNHFKIEEEENIMVKVEVIREFTLQEFEKARNIVRKDENKNLSGFLYEGDTFECDENTFSYLNGKNAKQAVVVKYLGEVEEKKPEIKETKIEKEPNDTFGSFHIKITDLRCQDACSRCQAPGLRRLRS